jgi:hypothetical protein
VNIELKEYKKKLAQKVGDQGVIFCNLSAGEAVKYIQSCLLDFDDVE